MKTPFDLNFVRSQFPAFSEPSLQGQVHFENAGGSYACQQVIERLCSYYRRTKVQPYYAFPASAEAGQQMDQAYEQLAVYLNVLPGEVHIGPSTSQNTVMLAQAFRKVLKAGDEIIVTNQDHEANIGAWRRLEADGLVIREWQVDLHTGELDPAQLDSLFTDKTRLLAFTHCSNVVAYINPVAEICRKARAAGVMTIVDGVSYAGHGLPDVTALGADIYLFSLYKTYGPHQGVMTIRYPVAKYLGNQAHFFLEGVGHKQFNPAGPDHAQVAASNGVVEYFDALDKHHFDAPPNSQIKARRVGQLLRDAELVLLPELLAYLDHHPAVRLLGSTDATQRAATVSFVSSRHSAKQLGELLSHRGVMAGAGHFYGYRLIRAMGLEPEQGVVRLSFVHYTSPEDMQQMLRALDEVL